jgi:hypothetical protein
VHANQWGELVDGLKMLEDELFLFQSTLKRCRELVDVGLLDPVDVELRQLADGLSELDLGANVDKDLVVTLLQLVQR